MLTRVYVTGTILLHGVGKLGGEEDVLTLAGVLLEPLTYTFGVSDLFDPTVLRIASQVHRGRRFR